MAKMVSRILDLKEAIHLVLSADRDASNIVPTWQDFDVLQSIDKAISPLSCLTDILSGEHYVTVSAVLPMLHILETDLLNVKQKVLDECMCLSYEKATTATQSASESVPPAPKKRNIGTLFKIHETRIREEGQQPKGEGTQVVNTERQQATKEVYDYLSSSRLDFEEDPLLWWKGQPLNYPILGRAAQKYLCICTTSSPSEWLFSTAGNVVSSFRSTLKPDKVDMVVFLSINW